MPDRTDHIIDAIDGALEDWSVSTDAMRWTPEPITGLDAFERAHLNRWTDDRSPIAIGFDDSRADTALIMAAYRLEVGILAALTATPRIITDIC